MTVHLASRQVRGKVSIHRKRCACSFGQGAKFCQPCWRSICCPGSRVDEKIVAKIISSIQKRIWSACMPEVLLISFQLSDDLRPGSLLVFAAFHCSGNCPQCSVIRAPDALLEPHEYVTRECAPLRQACLSALQKKNGPQGGTVTNPKLPPCTLWSAPRCCASVLRWQM